MWNNFSNVLLTLNIFNMKRILIALDYDPTAQTVAEEGYTIARSTKAEVILLHVVPHEEYYVPIPYNPIMGFTGFRNTDTMVLNDMETLKAEAKDFLEKSKEHLADEYIQTIVEEGDAADAILKTALKLNADMIIMGSHSQRWLDHILMGSVTEKVFHHTTKPLLIIPIKESKK